MFTQTSWRGCINYTIKHITKISINKIIVHKKWYVETSTVLLHQRLRHNCVPQLDIRLHVRNIKKSQRFSLALCAITNCILLENSKQQQFYRYTFASLTSKTKEDNTSNSPEHHFPSPVYPSSQEQVKEPSTLEQVADKWQSCALAAHSSISIKRKMAK